MGVIMSTLNSVTQCLSVIAEALFLKIFGKELSPAMHNSNNMVIYGWHVKIGAGGDEKQASKFIIIKPKLLLYLAL